MLNWDDYGKEDNTTPQSSPQIDNEVVKKTAEAVAEEKSVTQQAVKAVSYTHLTLPTSR